MTRRNWNREEQLLALHLYCVLPFGQLHQRNPKVKAVAAAIRRTPSAVVMKACNFASLDPALQQQGLKNASQADKELWESFSGDSENLAMEVSNAIQCVVPEILDDSDALTPNETTNIDDTEVMKVVRVRKVQSFFRKSVLVSYGYKCCITGLDNPTLLVASHIIPWRDNVQRRADPTNGLALNVFHDKLFDAGLMTFDENLRVKLSDYCNEFSYDNEILHGAFDIDGRELCMPIRFQPDMDALRYHRESVYEKKWKPL